MSQQQPLILGRFLGGAANGTPAKPTPAETARYLDNYALEIILSVEVSALLTIAAMGSYRFDLLALGFRMHQFSKAGAAYW